MWKKRLAYPLIVLLTACAQTAEFQRPELPVPAAWPTGVDAGGTQDIGQTQWQNYFADPRLRALIEAAIQNNRDMRIAVGRVEEARAQYRITRADKFPAVNLLGSGTLGQTPADLSGTGTVINGERYDLALTNVSYEVDFWGRIASMTESARNSFLASNEARRTFKLSLVADVASAYFNLLQLDGLLELARDSLRSRELSLAVIDKAREIGATYDVEYEIANGALEGQRSELHSVAQQRSVALNRLNYLVGETPADLPMGLDLAHQGLEATLAPGLPGDVLLQRPDVVAAELRLRAAHANIDAARAAFLPKIALTAGLGVASVGLASLFNGVAWNFQPSIGLPLFDGGKLSAAVDVAEARKVIAVAEYEKTIQLAFREVADLLSARESLALQQHSAELNEKSQQLRLKIATGRYQAGMTNILELLDAERNLVSARQMTVQLRRGQLETAAQLYKALGGGA